MISWLWLIPTLLVDAVMGIMIIALVSAGNNDDKKEVK